MIQDPNQPHIYDPNATDEDIDQWVQELYELEASHGVGAVPAHAVGAGNSTVNVRLIEQRADWKFSEWFPLENRQIDALDGADKPGVYDIGSPVPIARLNGESEIIYIGRAAAQKKGDRVTLRAALRRHVGKGSPSEQWSRLLRPGQQLIVRVANTDDVCQARYWEKLRMRWFIEQHWELPAGNTNRFHPATPINSLELARECRKWREWAYRIC